MLLFFLPVPGLLLYLAIGEPRFPRWRAREARRFRPFQARVKERLDPHRAGRPPASAALAERLGGLPAVAGNSIELISDYGAAVERLVADIGRAERSVSLVVYIFANDEVGRAIASALAHAVKRGVRCRAMIDSVGSSKWLPGTLAMLRAAGVQTQEALPFHWLRRRTRRDMRNHRKLVVIDGRIGYAGSQNIVARDFRAGVTNRELVARCTGPVVAAMESVIEGDWFHETGALPGLPPEVPGATGDSVLQLLPSGADYAMEGFRTLLVWQIHQARRRVVIVTPYFIPGQDVLAAMTTAAARKVRVDLIVSSVVDQRVVNLAQRSYYSELLRSGVRIHLYQGFLLHAKAVSVDETLAILGSSNVDLRSFQLNEEISLLLLDRQSIRSLRAEQERCLEGSLELGLPSWERRGRAVRVAENLARLVSPLL